MNQNLFEQALNDDSPINNSTQHVQTTPTSPPNYSNSVRQPIQQSTRPDLFGQQNVAQGQVGLNAFLQHADQEQPSSNKSKKSKESKGLFSKSKKLKPSQNSQPNLFGGPPQQMYAQQVPMQQAPPMQQSQPNQLTPLEQQALSQQSGQIPDLFSQPILTQPNPKKPKKEKKSKDKSSEGFFGFKKTKSTNPFNQLNSMGQPQGQIGHSNFLDEYNSLRDQYSYDGSGQPEQEPIQTQEPIQDYYNQPETSQDLFDQQPNQSDLFNQLGNSQNNINLEPKQLKVKRTMKDRWYEVRDFVKHIGKPKVVEEEEPEVEYTDWNIVEKVEQEQVLEETEDIVKTEDVEIGKVLKTKLDINSAKKANLSVRDNIALTKMFIMEDALAQEELDRQRAEEDKRVEHVQTLREFLQEELKAYLTDYNLELEVQIDSAFGEYIEETLELLSLSYDCKLLPRNEDILVINPNLPYRCLFRIKPLYS